MRDSYKIIIVVLALLIELGFPVPARPSLCRNGERYTNRPNGRLAKGGERAGYEVFSQDIRPVGRGLAVGAWGGKHIRLDVNPQGASVEFDCAQGTISQRIVVDRRGRFVADGNYIEEHGGPVRMNEPANSAPVRFTGQIRGKRMTLTVRRSDRRKLIGTFTLRYGQEGDLVKCR